MAGGLRALAIDGKRRGKITSPGWVFAVAVRPERAAPETELDQSPKIDECSRSSKVQSIVGSYGAGASVVENRNAVENREPPGALVAVVQAFEGDDDRC